MRLSKLITTSLLLIAPYLATNALAATEQTTHDKFAAVLVPNIESTLDSEIRGNIEEIAFREGQQFKKDDILLRFDCATHQANLDKAKADLMSSNATLESRQRLKELKSISDLDHKLAVADAQRAQAEVDGAAAIVERCMVIAPFDGTLVELKVNPHESVNEGEPLMKIIGYGAPHIEMLVPSTKIAGIKVGDSFQMAVDDTGGKYNATVKYIVPRIDPISQMFMVVGELGKIEKDLIAGMTGTALFDPQR